MIIPKHIIKIHPYRGAYETILKDVSRDTTIKLIDGLININIDYTHYIDVVDIETELEDNEVLQIENRVCEDTYINKNDITSISKQLENANSKNGIEHVYYILITAKGTMTTIRCKHNEEATELLEILFNWWVNGIYPKEQDKNITA